MEYDFTEIEQMVNEVQNELDERLSARHAIRFDYGEVLVIMRALLNEFHQATERFSEEGGSEELQFIGINTLSAIHILAGFILSQEMLGEWHESVREVLERLQP